MYKVSSLMKESDSHGVCIRRKNTKLTFYFERLIENDYWNYGFSW